MNVTIPEPGGPLLCGTAWTGQAICGQDRAADSYADFPLVLDAQPPNILAGGDVTLTVDFTGYLDLDAAAPVVSTQRNHTEVVTDTGYLDLSGSVGGQVRTGTTVVVATGGVLALDGGPVTLKIDLIFKITPEQTFPLELDAEPARVNPVLALFDCEPLDLDPSACEPLDLALLACEPLDLEASVPVEA